MRARFDGICVKCSEPIKGFTTHPLDCDDIAWPRRERADGLRGIAWHTRCAHLPDNPVRIAALLEKKREHSHYSAPVTESVTNAESIVSAETLVPIPVTAPTVPTNTALLEQLSALLPQLGITVPKTTAPVSKPTGKPITITAITERSKWWDVLEACIQCGMTRVLLVGPPGTGKSTTADKDGHRVTCHEDAGPESMVGTFIQKDGNTVWIDGPAVCAMRNGSRIVLDETDHSSPECVSLLYALLDDSPSIVLPTGETVRATKGYQVIGTSNSNPSDFPEAILDRFEAVIIAGEPHPLAVDGVRKDAGVKADALVGVMTNYYRSVNTSTYDFSSKPTLRKCRNFAKLINAGLTQAVAARVVFGKSAYEITSAMTTAGVR